MNDKHPNNHLANPLAYEEMGLLAENINTLGKATQFARNLLSGHRYQTGELTLMLIQFVRLLKIWAVQLKFAPQFTWHMLVGF
jgi:hypothetical protein